MVDFTDPAGPVTLPLGVTLYARGLHGSAEVHDAVAPGTRGGGIEAPTDALLEAMATTDMAEQVLVTIDVEPVGAGDTRGGGSGGNEVFLEVPQPGGQWGQALMAVHEGGVITWHLPRVAPTDSTVRGAGDVAEYHVALPELDEPVDEAARDQPDDEEGGTRGLMGLAGRVLLKALVFPLASRVAGSLAQHVATRWEDTHRPYGLRWFLPDDDRRNGQAMDDSDLAGLAGNRSLLLVHGTFSTAATGFHQLPQRLLGDLSHAYDGRVVAFEHPSMSVSPVDNVAWLRDHLAEARPLEFDVLTHSRGGLVGRVLAGGLAPVDGIDVATLVLGATPNHGTLLADPRHVVAFLDRSTTLLNLAPPGPSDLVQLAMEAVLVGVKALVAGGLDSLPGLASMNPNGAWLGTLNTAHDPNRPTQLHAIAADFEPTGALRRAFRIRAKDEVVDRVMGDVANDLVVPTRGVTGSADDPESLVSDPLVFGTDDNVFHSNIFAQRRTRERLVEWLDPTRS